MKSSIISLATLVSLAFASPPGLAERDPVICIGCVNTQNCDPPCYVVGATPGGAGGTCECPEPGEGEGCPDGCGPAGSACYILGDTTTLCDCGTYCEDNGLGTCGADQICTG